VHRLDDFTADFVLVLYPHRWVFHEPGSGEYKKTIGKTIRERGIEKRKRFCKDASFFVVGDLENQ
jgi:hypothetical protein